MKVRPEGAKEWLLYNQIVCCPYRALSPLVRITQGAAVLALGYVVLRLQRASLDIFGLVWLEKNLCFLCFLCNLCEVF